MIIIYKGDDTGGTFGRTISIQLKTHKCAPLTGCTAEFIFDGIIKSWTNIEPGQYVELFYSHNETGAMALGERKAILRIIDAAGKIRTLDNAIPVIVTNRLEKVYPGCSKISYCIGTTVSWDSIIGKPESIVQTVNGNPPDASGNVQVEGSVSPDLIETVSNLVKTVALMQRELQQINARFSEYKTTVDSDRDYVNRGAIVGIDPFVNPIEAMPEEIAQKVNDILNAIKRIPLMQTQEEE